MEGTVSLSQITLTKTHPNPNSLGAWRVAGGGWIVKCGMDQLEYMEISGGTFGLGYVGFPNASQGVQV
jgi:hypothetical protein